MSEASSAIAACPSTSLYSNDPNVSEIVPPDLFATRAARANCCHNLSSAAPALPSPVHLCSHTCHSVSGQSTTSEQQIFQKKLLRVLRRLLFTLCWLKPPPMPQCDSKMSATSRVTMVNDTTCGLFFEKNAAKPAFRSDLRSG